MERITMLGTTQSGKTCYMLAMYGKMSGKGINGFNLVTTDYDQGLDMYLRWQNLKRKGAEREWPARNEAEVIKYSFRLTYATDPLSEFEWIDYRGGALYSKSSEKDKRELYQYLMSSHCVYLCVSGEHIEQDKTNSELDDIQGEIGITPMMQSLVDLRKGKRISSNNPFPVVILVTKWDRCRHRGQKKIVSDLKYLFEPLFIKDNGWHVMLSPSTLGNGLMEDMNNAEIHPEYIHWPLIFAIHAKKRDYRDAEKKKEAERESSYEKDLNKGWLKQWWEGIDNSSLRSSRDEIARVRGNIEEIERQMNLLAQEIKTEEIYINGRKIGGEKEEE